MISILKPKKYINDLWGMQKDRGKKSYRLMKYVLRVDHEDGVLLHNAVTGQLVLLDQAESEILIKLPLKYECAMEQLVDSHFLVPIDYDEHQTVINMRQILRKLEKAHRTGTITKFTILPTTACNARCYYCFERGAKTVTMSEQTADEVAEFIIDHCRNKQTAHITWFGGEPTVASKRIDQISRRLRDEGIDYYSDMTTNGFLFDEEMAFKAKNLWNLEYLQICFDGLENRHNKTKNYINVKENAYQRTLRNIGLLLNQSIQVGMRMNFDVENYQDFFGLVKEAVTRFGNNPSLSVYAFPIIGEYKNNDGIITHGSTDWFRSTIAKLNGYSRSQGAYHERHVLPILKYHCCDAENRNAITITANGKLVRCCQCFGDENQVGDLKHGITDIEQYHSWEESADFDNCKKCSYFPYCYRILKCPASDRCQFITEWCTRNEKLITDTYEKVMKNRKEM